MSSAVRPSPSRRPRDVPRASRDPGAREQVGRHRAAQRDGVGCGRELGPQQVHEQLHVRRRRRRRAAPGVRTVTGPFRAPARRASTTSSASAQRVALRGVRVEQLGGCRRAASWPPARSRTVRRTGAPALRTPARAGRAPASPAGASSLAASSAVAGSTRCGTTTRADELPQRRRRAGRHRPAGGCPRPRPRRGTTGFAPGSRPPNPATRAVRARRSAGRASTPWPGPARLDDSGQHGRQVGVEQRGRRRHLPALCRAPARPTSRAMSAHRGSPVSTCCGDPRPRPVRAGPPGQRRRPNSSARQDVEVRRRPRGVGDDQLDQVREPVQLVAPRRAGRIEEASATASSASSSERRQHPSMRARVAA